jgi:hypothetical protein
MTAQRMVLELVGGLGILRDYPNEHNEMSLR